MAHESFEDAATAALMNAHYVNVKVDREERPDVDSIYMTAVQQMTGHGGWPMTVFLTPDGAPFWGGTYFPPEPRHGMPAFRQVLTALADAWDHRRGDVDRSAGELREMLERSGAVRPERAALDTGILDRAFEGLAARFDPRNGGLGGAPKFPQPMVLELMLRHWRRTGAAEALRMAEVTLRRMAAGGIYDHLGGGFHRYSVDAEWLVPHFEKMLYDNALLARVYLHAYLATGNDAYRRVVDETLEYALREMRTPEGAFASAQDADSEGEEGVFYVWTPEEIDAVLGADDGPLVRLYYGVAPGGNFEGRSILHVTRTVADAAAEAGVTAERMTNAVARARVALYEARGKRVWPGRDDKVLTAWNAMMIHTLAEAARVTERGEWRDAAVAAADFLLGSLRADGRLLRTYKDGRARIGAFLEDHALLADACLALYAATFDARWVAEARTLADEMLARFWDEATGQFFDTASDAEALVVRPRDVFDNATPSGNSVAVGVLLHLARLLGDDRYARPAVAVLESMAATAERVPVGFGHLLGALDFHLAVPREVAVAGVPGEPRTDALLEVLSRAYLPNVVVALARPDDAAGAAAIPLLQGREMVEGKAAAYVCERFACRLPVTEPRSLARELGLGASPAA
jgi:uncharacterized protein YyaL (SSP411 family)